MRLHRRERLCRMSSWVPFAAVALGACAGASASARSRASAPPSASLPGAPGPTAAATVNAGRTICEAECRRDDRCATGSGGPSCTQRCTEIVPLDPPAWRMDWATEVAACIEQAACSHDADEDCVLPGTQHSASARTCLASARTARDTGRCATLNGLLPDADLRVDGCLRSGGGFSDCVPRFEWK